MIDFDIDMPTLNGLDDSEITNEIPAIKEVPVKMNEAIVKSLQTAQASLPTSKFLPKFDKKEKKIATVISALETEGCQG